LGKGRLVFPIANLDRWRASGGQAREQKAEEVDPVAQERIVNFFRIHDL